MCTRALAIGADGHAALSGPGRMAQFVPRILHSAGRMPRSATAWNPLAIIGPKDAKRRLAQVHRLLQHRIEHRRQVAGRRIDHLQHLGSRGLLLQRLPLLGDQPRVLHRDHRLGGEVLQQRDLLVGERPHFLAIDREHPSNALVLAQAHPSSVRRRPVRRSRATASRLPYTSRLASVVGCGQRRSPSAIRPISDTGRPVGGCMTNSA